MGYFNSSTLERNFFLSFSFFSRSRSTPNNSKLSCNLISNDYGKYLLPDKFVEVETFSLAEKEDSKNTRWNVFLNIDLFLLCRSRFVGHNASGRSIDPRWIKLNGEQQILRFVLFSFTR